VVALECDRHILGLPGSRRREASRAGTGADTDALLAGEGGPGLAPGVVGHLPVDPGRLAGDRWVRRHDGLDRRRAAPDHDVATDRRGGSVDVVAGVLSDEALLARVIPTQGAEATRRGHRARGAF